jgi:antitoxin MazE
MRAVNRLDRARRPTYTQCILAEVAVRTKIQKWGNSLGLRIPRSFAAEAGVAAGSDVDLSIRNGDLVVRPARRRKYRLSDLVRKITPKNLHGEVCAGAPVGREVW